MHSSTINNIHRKKLISDDVGISVNTALTHTLQHPVDSINKALAGGILRLFAAITSQVVFFRFIKMNSF